MHLHAPAPFKPPLPWVVRERRLQSRTRIEPLHLDNARIVKFNALLHELHPDASHVDARRLDALADWLLRLPEDEARKVLDVRLVRLQQLGAMLDDEDWDADPATRARLAKLFGYLDDDDGLIPDDTPRIGRMDDVLLAELAWPAFANEAEDYADYCDYRQKNHPTGAPAQRRRAWVEARLTEFAALRRRAAVRNRHYIRLVVDKPLRVR